MRLFLNTKIILGLSAIFIIQLNSEKSVLLNGCNSVTKTQEQNPSLKEAFKNDFLIGTALNTAQIEEKDPLAAILIPQQFNAITPENIMKSEIIHPGWDTYNFEMADKMVAYGKKYNMKVNGHTLIWHSQLPGFVRNMKDADSVKQFFTNHINKVAGRYDGKIFSWDVVNEALEEDGSLRKSIFSEKIGSDFVTEAFKMAQKAAPNTELYYNDYNIEQPKKRAGAIALIKKIQAAEENYEWQSAADELDKKLSDMGINSDQAIAEMMKNVRQKKQFRVG